MHKRNQNNTNTTLHYTNAEMMDDEPVITINVKSADGRMETTLHLSMKDAETLVDEIRHKLAMAELSRLMTAAFADAD